MGNHPDVPPPRDSRYDPIIELLISASNIPADAAFEGVQILFDAPGQPVRVYIRSSAANRRVTGLGQSFYEACDDALGKL